MIPRIPSLKFGKIIAVSVTEEGVPVASVSVAGQGETYTDVRFVDLGGGDSKRFSHAPPSGVFGGEDVADAYFESADVVLGFVESGVTRRKYPVILGVLRSGAASSILSAEPTQTEPTQTPSQRIDPSRDRAEVNNGAQSIWRTNGSIENNTAASNQAQKVVVGKDQFVRFSHGEVRDGELVESFSVEERVILARAFQAWFNTEVQPKLTQLQATVNQVVGVLRTAGGAATGPAPGDAYAVAAATGASNLEGSLALVPTMGDELIASIFQISTKSLDDEPA